MPFGSPFKLLLAFVLLVSSAFADTIYYLDNSQTGGNGSEAAPFANFQTLFLGIRSRILLNDYDNITIMLKETTTPYTLPQSISSLSFQGFNLTLQSWTYNSTINGSLSSNQTCSSFAKLKFSGGALTADWIHWNGITLATDSSQSNLIGILGLNHTISNTCFEVNATVAVTTSKKKDTSLSLEDGPSEEAIGYLMKLYAYNNSILCNVTMQNVFVIGALKNPPILTAINVNRMEITNLTVNTLPQMNIISKETYIKGFNFIMANYSSQMTVLNSLGENKTIPCFSKISYLSTVNLTDFMVNGLAISGHPYFFCFYQSTVLDTQVTRLQQNLTISNVTFVNNTVNITAAWSLFYVRRATNIEGVLPFVNISNVTALNNRIILKNLGIVDNFLVTFQSVGEMEINNITYMNNTNLKFVYFTSESTQLPSNLRMFKDIWFQNNTWTQGTLAVNHFLLNPNNPAQSPILISTNISNITMKNNIQSKTFFSMTNSALYFDLSYLYLTPRAWMTNITLMNSQVSSSNLFVLQMYNLDLNNTWTANSSFTSSNFLQSTTGAAPLQVNNVTVQDCNFSNSNMIYKIFDTSILVEYMTSDLDNNTTPIPLSLFVNNFFARRNVLMDYSRVFRIKGAPIIIIKSSEFVNFTMNSSSTILWASDLLSLLSSILFDAQTVLQGGYQRYLQYIGNANLTASFMSSLPFNEMYELNYSSAKYSTRGVTFVYRMMDCNFANLSLEQANLIDLSAINMNQSVVSVDRNNFSRINLTSVQDSFIRSSSVKLVSFAYNEIKQIRGAGAVLSQTGVNVLTITNNYLHDNSGSSFLRFSSVLNKGLFIGNNTINNITTLSTFISINILQNTGQVVFRNNTFNNCSIVSDPKAYKQLNFILIDNQMSDGEGTAPNFHIKNCSFTNISIYKNHTLIKQYLNSFLVANLASDSLVIENSKFDNISVRYDSNLLFIVTKDLKINSTVISNIENNEKVGSLYLLTVTALINNSQFINNSAIAGLGGAIYIDYDSLKDSGTELQIMNSVFTNNTALEGSAIYYSTRNINFTAYNNTFLNCLINQDQGSLITFFNATLDALNLTSNTITYNKDVVFFTKLLNFDTTKAATGALLQINKTTIKLTKGFYGTLFNIQNTQGNFTFDGLTVYNDSSAPPSSMNKFSLMDFMGGSVVIKNAKVSNLASNLRPFIDVLCEKSTDSYLKIENSNFVLLTSTSNKGTMTDTYDDDYRGIIHLSNRLGGLGCLNTVEINKTNFERFNYYYYSSGNLLDSSAIVVDYNGQFNLNIQESNFSSLGASQGSAILLVNTPNDKNVISIKKNLFTGVISQFEGGAIFNKLNNLEMVDNQFSDCRALQRSGAAFYSQVQMDWADLQLKNSFQNLYRYYSFSFRDSLPLGSEPSLLNLSFSMPSYINMQTTNGAIYLTNFSSYDLQKINISAVLIDHLNQIVYDASSSTSGEKEFTLYIGGALGDFKSCNDYTCTMIQPSVILSGNASQVFEGQFSYKSSIFQLSSSKFYIVLRECINGELDSTVTGDFSGAQCTPCPSDKYGLNVATDKECTACPENAKCTGGNNILVNAGYWRQSTSTVKIMECRTSSYCLGGFESTCAEGNTGLLCDSCDTANGYVKSQSGCKACPTAKKSLLYSLIAFVIVLFFQLWYIKTTRVSNSYFVVNCQNVNSDIGREDELKISQGMHVRLLTTYAQILGIIATFNLDFSSMIQTLGSITESFSDPELSLFSSIECSFLDLGLDANHFVYYRVLYSVLSPIFKGILLLFYRLVYWKFKVNQKRFSILIITGVCLFLLEQPSISHQLFGFLTCTQVQGDSKYYLQQDLRYECYTPEYNSFRNLVVLPALLIYVVLLPLFFFLVLFNNKDETGTGHVNSKVRMYFGAIYNEYTPKAYFWGIYLIVTKSILMFLKSSFDYDVKTKALSVFIVLYIYYALFVKLHPLQRKDLYQVERFALISYLMTIFGSIYYKDNTSSMARVITLVAITLLNFYVFALLIWGSSKIYFEKVRLFTGWVIRKYRGENKLDVDFSLETTADDISRDEGVADKEAKKEVTNLTLDEVEERIFGKKSSSPQKVVIKETELFSFSSSPTSKQ